MLGGALGYKFKSSGESNIAGYGGRVVRWKSDDAKAAEASGTAVLGIATISNQDPQFCGMAGLHAASRSVSVEEFRVLALTLANQYASNARLYKDQVSRQCMGWSRWSERPESSECGHWAGASLFESSVRVWVRLRV